MSPTFSSLAMIGHTYTCIRYVTEDVLVTCNSAASCNKWLQQWNLFISAYTNGHRAAPVTELHSPIGSMVKN